MTQTTLSPEELADLKAKSLGEKLCDAIHLPLMYTSRAPWSTLGLDSRGSYEVAALAFAASLTHDETASAVIASLRTALEEAEGRIAYALSVAERMAERADKLNEAGDYSADAWGGAAAQIRAALSPYKSEADNG